MIVVTGPKRSVVLSDERFEERRRVAGRVVVDLGTGDGRFPYRLAGDDDTALVIGVDAVQANLAEVAARAGRKPAKGGRANLLLVHASVEALPDALRGVADDVFVLLPWGSLLEGIVLADPTILEAVAAIGRAGAAVHVVLNAEIWHENTPGRFADLPVPTAEHAAEVIVPGFAAAGLDVTDVRYLAADETAAMPTTWAKRLGSTRDHPRFLAIDATRRADGDG
ncbi:MAG TPA: class I SAM-dependent methyltransferase [Acidimicrobiales bacterium]